MQPTLLLIDDEENILHSLKRLFRKQPFRVVTATSGAEALEVMQREEVSVILSDQRMPQMTGSELLKKIKITHPDTVRIVMSGYTELESITAAIKDGVISRFLVKPWDDQKLMEHIHEAFSIHEFKTGGDNQQEPLKQTNLSLDQKAATEQQETDVSYQGLKLSQAILEQIPIMVVSLDDSGTLLTANSKARELLSGDSIVGLPMAHVLPDELVAVIQQVQVLQQGLARTDADPEIKSVTLTLSCRRILFKVSRFWGPVDAMGIVIAGCMLEDQG